MPLPTRCFIKKETPFGFFHNSLKWWSINTKFVPIVAEEIPIQNIATKYGSWLNMFCYSWRNADVIMCHGYKLDSLNWCCQLLPCSNGKKSGSFMTNCWSFIVTVTKKMQSDVIYVSVGTVGLLSVRARQRTSTPSLQNGFVFGSQDAWFRVHMLLSADTINIFHYRTRLSSPSKLGTNWQHQLRLSDLYLWHIMSSALRHH